MRTVDPEQSGARARVEATGCDGTQCGAILQHWHVMRFHLKLMLTFVRSLEHIGFDHRVFTFRRRMPKRRSIVTCHWFPGYVFVRFAASDNWQQLGRVPGAIDILGGPTPIDEVEFNDLLVRCPDTLLENDADTVIPAGSEVRVLEGPFRDMTGIVVSSKGTMAWVELMAFNRPVRSEVRTRHIRILR